MTGRCTIPVTALGTYPCARLGQGGLAIGHRPRLRSLRNLMQMGFTHVVSVLSAAEEPADIREAAGMAGLTWLWIPLGSTKTLPKRGKAELAAALDELMAILDKEGNVYLHCSAGIHRTGMITAALFFRMGYKETDVRETLHRLRAVTGQQMGDQRFQWAGSFCTSRDGGPV